MINIEDTIIAPITSADSGSVSILRISGPETFIFCEKYFTTKFNKNESGHFYFGKILNNSKQIIDEVILLIYKAPESYTGEDIAEICCHSNSIIVQEIIKIFLEIGCRYAEPGEFTKRAFLNNKMDLIQAEAVAEIITSKSEEEKRLWMMHLEGKLSKKLKKIRHDFVYLNAVIEYDLEFNEEENTYHRDEIKSKAKEIQIFFNELRENFEILKSYKKGTTVVLAGKTNVGKSSLMNSVLQQERVLVSNIHGTTRDYIEEDIILNDTIIKIIDTAGIKKADNSLEEKAILKTQEICDSADLVLYVFDISSNLSEIDESLIESIVNLHYNKSILICNKSDMPSCSNTVHRLKSLSLPIAVVSAKTKTNLDKMLNTIYDRIPQKQRTITRDMLIINERQKHLIDVATKAIIKTIEGMDSRIGYEFLSAEIRSIITNISEMIGEITTEDILDVIFSNFCIGK